MDFSLSPEHQAAQATTRELGRKIVTHASPTGELHFENCPVPELNRGEKEGEGFYLAMESLDRGRLSANILKILIANDTLGYKKANRSPAG
jgi:alkylation response protein AidB-like acyl-CoA dehydrogenase